MIETGTRPTVCGPAPERRAVAVGRTQAGTVLLRPGMLGCSGSPGWFQKTALLLEFSDEPIRLVHNAIAAVSSFPRRGADGH
ncbi:MAG: hypothetical protein AVDCRST_MAG73-1500 [uncultured Thermomicrobiales bacterium]|uniref:Uncharacterized protein n=1 Tax=uncultured Thermomicrobiales bacterium TaxID=1645740 RepID=A0A6J4U0G7_9BACT|nr:MAG: hypothetical protein AVDCRST_MAG73-1500 [uncultured Thermomicrobiales bacterium]